MSPKTKSCLNNTVIIKHGFDVEWWYNTLFDDSKPLLNKDLLTKKECRSGCQCKEGYLQNENLKCIPEAECSSTICPENMEWSYCKTPCPVKCTRFGDVKPCYNHV